MQFCNSLYQSDPSDTLSIQTSIIASCVTKGSERERREAEKRICGRNEFILITIIILRLRENPRMVMKEIMWQGYLVQVIILGTLSSNHIWQLWGSYFESNRPSMEHQRQIHGSMCGCHISTDYGIM